MPSRCHDWPERLASEIIAASRKPFAWGSHDCVLWACSVCRVLTGIDPASDFRGGYSTRRGADELVRMYGGSLLQLARMMAEKYGIREINAKEAGRGDIVFHTVGSRKLESLGICLGAKAAAPGPKGLAIFPMSHVLTAWRV